MQKDAILGVKSSVQHLLTYNRRHAKMVLYNSLLLTIGCPDKARRQGFYFELAEPSPPEFVPEDIPGKIWDIAKANFDDFSKASSPADGLSDNLFFALSDSFPSLTVVAHW